MHFHSVVFYNKPTSLPLQGHRQEAERLPEDFCLYHHPLFPAGLSGTHRRNFPFHVILLGTTESHRTSLESGHQAQTKGLDQNHQKCWKYFAALIHTGFIFWLKKPSPSKQTLQKKVHFWDYVTSPAMVLWALVLTATALAHCKSKEI